MPLELYKINQQKTNDFFSDENLSNFLSACLKFLENNQAYYYSSSPSALEFIKSLIYNGKVYNENFLDFLSKQKQDSNFKIKLEGFSDLEANYLNSLFKVHNVKGVSIKKDRDGFYFYFNFSNQDLKKLYTSFENPFSKFFDSNITATSIPKTNEVSKSSWEEILGIILVSSYFLYNLYSIFKGKPPKKEAFNDYKNEQPKTQKSNQNNKNYFSKEYYKNEYINSSFGTFHIPTKNFTSKIDLIVIKQKGELTLLPKGQSVILNDGDIVCNITSKGANYYLQSFTFENGGFNYTKTINIQPIFEKKLVGLFIDNDRLVFFSDNVLLIREDKSNFLRPNYNYFSWQFKEGDIILYGSDGKNYYFLKKENGIFINYHFPKESVKFNQQKNINQTKNQVYDKKSTKTNESTKEDKNKNQETKKEQPKTQSNQSNANFDKTKNNLQNKIPKKQPAYGKSIFGGKLSNGTIVNERCINIEALLKQYDVKINYSGNESLKKSLKEARTKIKKLIKFYHPDSPTNLPMSVKEEMTKELNVIFNMLGNEDHFFHYLRTGDYRNYRIKK
jgi:hypothetical protein